MLAGMVWSAIGSASRRRWQRAAAGALAMLVLHASGCGPALRPDRLDADSAPRPGYREPAVFALGRVRPLDHPDFAPVADRGTPEAPVTGAPPGIYFLEPFEPQRIPVLFVPGIGGTPHDFRPMIAALDRARFQAWVYRYPTGVRLESAARLLRELLAELRRTYRFDALVVTAHSMGGLVARAYASEALADGEYPRVIVTFASPWEGHPWAAVGARLAVAPSPVWLDLSPGSEFLASLRRPLGHGGRRIPHYVFFAFRRDISLLMPQSSDGVIPVASQLPPWLQEQAERCWGYDATHVGILSDGAALDRYYAVLKSEADRIGAASSGTLESGKPSVIHL